MKQVLLPATLILALTFLPSVGNAESTKYGQKFEFKPGSGTEFPDFHLQFVEQKPGSFFPGSTTLRMGDVYEFRLSSLGANKIIRWSSGTGDLGPTAFKVQGKCFWLELKTSDEFGKLDDNQGIVSLRRSPTDCRPDEEAR